MVVSFHLGPAGAGDLCGVESLKSRNTTAGSLQRAARRGCAARPFSASGSCGRFHVGLSFLRPGAAGCSWLLCGRCSFTSALEALTQPPLGELCAVPFALVGVQRARSRLAGAPCRLWCGGRSGGPRCRPADLRADATPRSSSCPRRSGSGTFPSVSPPSYGVVVKKKRTADSLESLCV